MRGRGFRARRWGVILLLTSLLLPLTTTVRADGPTIAPLTLPVAPGGITHPRLSGTQVVWQDTGGVFGIDLTNGQALRIPASNGSEPDIAGSIVVWKQGASGLAGVDLASNAPFTVPVGDAKIAAPSVGESGVVAWLSLDASGLAVRVWDRATGTTAEAGRIPTARFAQETLGVPRVSGHRVIFPHLTADPSRLSRMILFDLDSGERLAINDAFGGKEAVFAFAKNRLALAQGTRILVYDFATTAVESIAATLSGQDQIASVGFDGATVVYTVTSNKLFGYDLARHVGYAIQSQHAAIAAPVVSGANVVWAEGGGTLGGRTITFPDAAPPVVIRQDLRYFPQTGYVIGYSFLIYWNANGGTAIFGYPLTNEALDAGSQLAVQYFERARFEYHPEAAGLPQAVQLTNLGRIVTAGRTDPAFPPQPLVPAGPDRAYFVQSQHSIGGQFKKFFDQNGGTAIFGYPISEETIEPNPTDGGTYTVQWFERARFEFHPEFNDTPNAIELGQLGRQLLLGQVGLYRPQCSPLFIQKPLLPECR